MLLLIEKYLFYLFLFSIPFQTRKILYYDGWRFNEWQSISIYTTDILLLILLGFWAINFLKSYKLQVTSYKLQKSDLFLIAFLAISAVSIKNSSNPIISWFQWLKLVEFVVFYWYLSRYAFAKFGLFNSFLTIMMGGLFQAVTAIIQLIKQSSIGLRYLGESVINGDLSGIASFYLPTGEKIIRAYGTMPHPNVLAAFLLLALFAFYFVYLYSRLFGEARPEGAARLHSEHSALADTWDKTMLVFYGIILFAFFATFSRVAVFIWFVSFCFRSVIVRAFKRYRIIFGTKEGRKRIIAILLVSLCVIVLFGSLYFEEIFSRFTIDKEDQSVELRAFYLKEAFKAGEGINLLGVGIGNFVGWLIEQHPYLPYYVYQPVHNIYLLMYSETGILGLSAFIMFLTFLIKDFIKRTRFRKAYHLSGLVLLGSFLFIGFFDHFFWTLQQGRFVFWLGLGVLTYFSSNDIM
ncbi:MAG: O-antigen ligase family protein [Candidatus Taylorbacteria bacterium]|nr:O-antigen ligase family protein [Candidatus Taylorbacteria bacterium]